MAIYQAIIFFVPSIIVLLFLLLLRYTVPMTVENQVRYRLRFRCDGCGREEFCQSTWEHLEGDRTAYLPEGWAHFFGISVLQINDVRRTGRDLDFCDDCVQRKTIESLIVKLPFDEHSLKTVIPAPAHKAAA